MSIDCLCPNLNANVYQSEDDLFLFTLNKTDITSNSNKFFICQLLETKDNRSFFIYTRFGRLGYDGKWNIDCFLNKTMAIKSFTDLFYNKTGHKWNNRSNRTDLIPGKYSYILTKHDSGDYLKNLEEQTKKNDLPDSSVLNLIKIIFDPDHYNTIAKQFDLDSTRAPLGVIKHSQIKHAYKIIEKLQNILAGAGSEEIDQEKILALSSDFYSIIPTSSKMSKLPILDNSSIIDDKINLLEVLENMKDLSSLRSTNIKENIKYQSLRCSITSATVGEYNKVCTYFNNTNNSKLSIVNCFKIDRENEELSLHNHKLLWHGSRIENFVSILSNGLQLHPSNVKRQGSMFGNGLYFANCSRKSAGYIGTSKYCLMLLCEVALGNELKLFNAKHISNLQNEAGGEYHSVHGVGKFSPSNSTKISINEIDIPVGPLVTKINESNMCALNYDEFIVYKESQVKLRYLLLIRKN